MTELINKQDIEMILSTTMDLKNACLKETLKTNIEQDYKNMLCFEHVPIIKATPWSYGIMLTDPQHTHSEQEDA
jgi:hypothetical protein